MAKISEFARDPLAHISLAMGDAIAFFVLGIMLGIIGNTVWSARVCAWFV